MCPSLSGSQLAGDSACLQISIVDIDLTEVIFIKCYNVTEMFYKFLKLAAVFSLHLYAGLLFLF